MDAIAWLLETAFNPIVAYVLLLLGLSALLFELTAPGHVLPGLLGAVLTVLALYVLASLQASFVGLLFIVLAFALFAAESLEPGFGGFALAGFAALALGSLLVLSPADLSLTVSSVAVAVLMLAAAAYFLVAVRGVARARRRRASTGREGLVDAVGEARTELNPRGYVLVDGELWQAVSPLGPIPAGERVQVSSIEGFHLVVFTADDEISWAGPTPLPPR